MARRYFALIAHAMRKLGLAHNFILGDFLEIKQCPFKKEIRNGCWQRSMKVMAQLISLTPKSPFVELDWDHCDHYKNLDS